MGIVLKKEIVYQRIKRDIVDGRYAYADKLPPLLELAEELGVSMQTMRDAAERLDNDGYIKRVHGRGTFVNWNGSRDSRKKRLLLEAPSDQASSNNVLIPLILKYAEVENMSIEVCSYEFIACQPIEDSLDYLRKNEIAGIINTASGYTGSEKAIDFFHKCGIPVVLPHAQKGDGKLLGAASLHPCEFTAFTDGIRYFAENGHRRIAVLGLPREETIREVGIEELMKLFDELGCDADPAFFTLAEYDHDDIAEKTRSLMKRTNPPTAILCFSDFYAIHLYSALKVLGLSIPRSVAVMGYCNSPGGSVLNPPLSTIDIGHDEAARSTINLLKNSDEWFGKKGVDRPERMVKHTIVERGSTDIKRIEYKNNES